MKLDDLLKQAKDAGVYPILVEQNSDRAADLEFVGTLDEYLKAVKAAGAAVVFVSAISLNEEHFEHQPEHRDRPQFDDVADESIDLCAGAPKLQPFRKRIGTIGCFTLAAPIQSYSLTLTILEEWFETFIDLRDDAIEMIDERLARETVAREKAVVRDAQVSVAKLRSLIDDAKFVRLPTQRAMREYALDKFPEIESLDDKQLKGELQTLSAKIRAKGLR